MKKLMMSFLIILSMVAAGCSPSSQVAKDGEATDFPKKPIELIVPYAAGGPSDSTARVLAKTAEKYLPNGQTIVIVNKPGGGGTIGLADVFKAKPDGYTIGLTAIGPVSTQPHYGNTPYSYDSFQPIMRVSSLPLALVVKSDAPWKTFEEWLEYAKQNPNKFSYGTTGAGSAPQLAMEALNLAAGIQTKPVSFEGNAPVITNLLGGHIQGGVILLNEVEPLKDKLRPLVNLGSTKIEPFTDSPLLNEKGIDVSVDITTGVLAPKELPQEILTILHDAFKKALEDPELLEQFEKLKVNPAYAGPEDYQKELKERFDTDGEILKRVGLIK
ncbi:Bug family tripartite tricarboxylate transporter substrate binding protein [Ammoniphilus sp. 3BR4]|uniref:Bug family tripartite tricarboxylate transporter substrate binding protein n=1 Tax=Ammoniphilus sp. 3BR4 TaxID=3158265 RepID=UPI003464E8EA